MTESFLPPPKEKMHGYDNLFLSYLTEAGRISLGIQAK